MWPSRQREVVGVRDQDVVVGLGAEHEHDVAVEHAQREHRPVALVGVEQQASGSAAKRACAAQAGRASPGGNGTARALGAQVVPTRRSGFVDDRRRAGQ